MNRLVPLAPVFALVLLGATTAHSEELVFEKYQLDNGLTVILHEDHSLPRVAVNIWYHVGSREEKRGRSGFAHLFEHLMFMGTHRVPDNQFDVIMEGGGGSNNATTAEDRTNYFSSGPSSLLPTLLWLEADRMEAVGSAMTQAKLDKQRDVVRNERRQSYDNAPYGPADLLVTEEMYPLDHPYHFNVIGSHEDLIAATVDDVKEFFATYYVPNNASLVVAGDFDSAEVKKLVQGLFGSLERRPEPPRRTAAPVVLEKEKRVTVQDDVQLPRLTMVWHSPPFFQPGDAQMDILADILAGGKSGRLYKRLVHDERLAVDVSAYQDSLRLGSLFYVEIMVAPGADRSRVEAIVDEEVARLRTSLPEARELERAKNGIESSTLSRLQSLLRLADRLNEYDDYLGSPGKLEWDLGRYRSTRPEDVRTWAGRVLDPDRRLVLWVLPEEGEEHVEGPRDHQPASVTPKPFVAPGPARFTLGNGLQVWHWDRPGLPLVQMQLVLPNGSLRDAAGEEGEAALAARMLEEGAGDLDAVSFADTLEVMGSSLSTAVSADSTVVTVQTLLSKLPRTTELFASALAQPRFAPADFERVRSQVKSRLEQRADDADQVARQLGQDAFFGPASAYGRPSPGYPHSVGALTLEAVKAFHDEYHKPQGAILLVAGDVRDAELKSLLSEKLGTWVAGSPPPPTAPASPPQPEARGPLRVLLVDRPDAEQTAVRFVLPGQRFGSPDREVADVLNTLFGGSFTSRLNQNLREDKGYTYGAGSRFDRYVGAGTFVAAASVETDVTGASLAEFLTEFARLRTGEIAEEELEKARATIASDLVQSFETLAGVTGAYAAYARNGEGPEALMRSLAQVEGVESAQVSALAKAAGRLDGGVLVLVGDRERILPQLEGLGLPEPQALDAEDALEGRLAE